MPTIVYMMVNEGRDSFHVGHTKNIKETAKRYNIVPCISWPPRQLNRLVFMEEYADNEMGKARFEEITRLPNGVKYDLVCQQNPDWIEYPVDIKFIYK